MPRRDVDLVIRARDEAKATLNAITTALKNFGAGQEDAQRASADTDNSLTQLAGSFRELQQSLRGASVGGRIQAEVTQARGAYDRLQEAVRETRVTIERYGVEARQSAQHTMQLRMQAELLAARIERQEAAVAGARNAQRRLTTETDRATRAQRSYVGAQANLEQQLRRQEQVLAQQQMRFRSLQATIITTSRPTRRVVRDFEAIGNTVARTQGRIRELTETFGLVSAESDRSARSVQRANDLYGRQAGSLNRLQMELTELRGNYNGLNQSIDASVRHQARAEAAGEKAVQTLNQQSGALQRAEAGYREIQGAAASTDAALQRLGQRVRLSLLQALREQAQRVREMRSGFEEARRAAARLGREFHSTAAPSRVLTNAFETAREAARQARRELRAQGGVLRDLRSIFRETGGDVAQFASRQSRAAEALNRASIGFRNYDAAARRAATANERLATAQRQAARASEATATAAGRTATATRRAARETNILASAIQRFFGGSRQALSFFQRLRSEILALTAAYGGLFAAIQGIRGVLQAGIVLQGIANRLRVVFEGDEGRVASELDFLRRSADRLGIAFGTLANEYSKFAIATQGTILAGRATRDIFLSVAEAARVQNLSLDQIQGTFLALTQIVSKGVVSMEELRRQLGDRLPGAIQIMAAALELSVAELIKLVENGDLSSDVLAKFADELNRRFGPQLSRALLNVSTALGRFQNQVFQTFVRIGQAGAVQGLTDLFNRLSDVLASPQFQSFADRIGAGLGALARGVSIVVENFDTLALVVGFVLARRVAPVITALLVTIGKLPAAIAAARVQMVGFGAATAGATTAVVGLGAAVRGFLLTTGVGAVVAAIGVGIASWVTSTDQATEALNRHQKALDAVRNAYDIAGNNVDNFRDAVRENLSVSEAQGNLERLRQELQRLRNEIELGGQVDFAARVFGFGFTTRGGDVTEKAIADIQRLTQEFARGEIDATDFRQGIDLVATSVRSVAPGLLEITTNLIELSRKFQGIEGDIDQNNDILRALIGTSREATEALSRLGNALDDTGGAAQSQAQRIKEFQEAIEAFEREIPRIGSELEALDDIEAIEEKARQLVRMAEEAGLSAEGIKAIRLELLQLARSDRVFGQARDGLLAAANLLAETTRLTGPDLARRTIELQRGLRNQLGEAAFDAVSPRQQAVLTAIAHALEGIPDALGKAIREGIESGSQEGIAELVRGIQGLPQADFLATIFAQDGFDVGTFIQNIKRAQQEADRAAEREQRNQERLAEQERRRTEARNQGTRDLLENQNFEIEQQERLNLGLEREAAIEQALRQAREQNPAIDESELNLVRFQAGVLFNLIRGQKYFDEQRRLAEQEAEARERAAEATRQQIAALGFNVSQQRLVNQGLNREAAIEAVIQQARRRNADITDEEVVALRERAGLLFDLQAQGREERRRQREAERQARLAEQQEEATRRQIADVTFQIEQQRRLNDNKGREAFIEDGIRQARQANVNISEEDVAILRERLGLLFELQNLGKEEEQRRREALDAERRVNDLVRLRAQLETELAALRDQGISNEQTQTLPEVIARLTTEIRIAAEQAIKLLEPFAALDPAIAAAISRLRVLGTEGTAAGVSIRLEFEQVARTFASSVSGGFFAFFDALKEGMSVVVSLREAFKRLAADFLRRIADMIVQQLALNAAMAIYRALGGPPLDGGAGGGSQRGGLLGSIGRIFGFQGGGIVGSRGQPINIPSAGRSGLGRDGFLAVVHEGEQIIPAGEAASGATGRDAPTIINAIDGPSFLEEALRQRRGQSTFLNYVSANRTSIRRALGVT